MMRPAMLVASMLILVACSSNQHRNSTAPTSTTSFGAKAAETSPTIFGANEALPASPVPCGPPYVSVMVTVAGDTSVWVRPITPDCQFSGKYPVLLKAGLQAPFAVGNLVRPAAYVQPFVAVSAIGCASPPANASPDITVEVEGQRVAVDVGVRVAHDIGCENFKAGNPMIERG